jgi:hypothetical protein
MKRTRFQSYPSGSSIGGGLPAHLAPDLVVDPDWIAANGSRAQRRRVARAAKRQGGKKVNRHG